MDGEEPGFEGGTDERRRACGVLRTRAPAPGRSPQPVHEHTAVAEELAQEALVRVMDAWPRVRAMAAPGAWAHRVAMNLAASWFRRRSAERRALARLEDHADDSPIEDVATVMAVRAAVARLPERQRRCLVLRHYLGYPIDVTAQTLGISEQAAASLTYRAMQSLRDRRDENTVPGSR